MRKETNVVAEPLTVLLASTEKCRTGGTICFLDEKLTQSFPTLMDNKGKNLCRENYSQAKYCTTAREDGEKIAKAEKYNVY